MITKQIICSHGFGVKADSRGMFPDIAAGFPNCNFHMFDYNEIKENGDTTVRPLDEQAKLLQEQIDRAKDGEIILLGHSRGCVTIGLVDLSRVSKVILLAPPTRSGYQNALNRIQGRQGSNINLDGLSVLPRSDGTTTYVPAEYFQSLVNEEPMELFQKIANTKPTVIVRATEDEVIGLTNVNEIKNAQHIDIASDHNFKGQHRQELIETLRMIF